MQLTDLLPFNQLLRRMGVVYEKPVSELLLQSWWEALEHLEFADIKKALDAYVISPDNGQFMPKPADVTKYLFGGSSAEKALRAWNEVVKAVREHGSYASVIFPDPLIHVVIRDMGGWIALCESKEANLPFRAKDFQTLYRALLVHPPPDCPHQLTGVFEKENRLSSSRVAEPTLIGEVLHKRISSEISR